MTGKEKELLNEMLNTIKRIKDQTDYIDAHERIPQLELDAIVARIEKLYKLSVGLKYFHAHIDEIVIERQKIIEEAKNQEKIDYSHEHNVAEEDIEDYSFDNSEEQIITSSNIVHEEDGKVKESLMQEMSNLTAETNHEKLSASDDESIVDRLMLQPISDLKTAIGINDKFQFINELFDGNADDFNLKLNQINSAASLDEAISILDNELLERKDSVSKSFLTLIERRFL